MILTFVHFLRDHFREHGQGTLQIRVLALVSLNGRKPQLMLDPDTDYAQVARTWGPQPWILPLREPLRKDPWVVPLTEWEQHDKLDEAIGSYRTSLRIEPGSSQVWNNLGVALAKQKQLEPAIEAFREAIKLTPDNASAHQHLQRAMTLLSKPSQKAL